MNNKEIERYKHYLYMLFKGYVHSVLCYSKGGLGKTYATINILKQQKIPYTYKSGVTTPMALYKLLYDNRNKILVLDDIETIFNNEYIINLLKAGLWEVDGKRIISYKTSSPMLKEYPESFEYTGGLIILANIIKGKKDESFKALMSRCLKCELIYTLDELKQISIEIVYSRQDIDTKQKYKIIEIVYRTIFPHHNFNFRLLERLIAFVKYNETKAEELFLGSLEIDDDMCALLNIIKTQKNVEKQQLKFTQLTGRSKTTFFRRKRKLRKEGLIK